MQPARMACGGLLPGLIQPEFITGISSAGDMEAVCSSCGDSSRRRAPVPTGIRAALASIGSPNIISPANIRILTAAAVSQAWQTLKTLFHTEGWPVYGQLIDSSLCLVTATAARSGTDAARAPSRRWAMT